MNSDRSPEEVLQEFIRKEFLFDREGVEVDSRTPLFENGLVDSVGILRLVGFVEQRFGVKIRSEDLVLQNFATIEAVVRLLRRRE